MDLCHRDGSLKQTVAADPGRYMHEDPRLAPTLESLRASGRKVFLATNSLWDYTHVVMNFLLCGAAHLPPLPPRNLVQVVSVGTHAAGFL